MSELSNEMSNEMDSVSQWLKNRTPLITGASGFVGKNLLLKLLNSSVKKIYLLVRKRKNISAKDRILKSLTDEGFYSENFEVIEADIILPNFGIDQDTLQKIYLEIDVIFHIAATINFNESLDKAFDINVRSTLKLLEFAQNCPKFQVFVHMSTAFTQIPLAKSITNERTYPGPKDPAQLLAMTPDELREFEKEIYLTGWPNTYTYTKSVAEDLVANFKGDFPVVILRPPLVVPAIEFPSFAWALDHCIVTHMHFLSGFRVNKYWYLETKHNQIPITPVDVCTNATIVSGWYQARKFRDLERFSSEEKSLVVNILDPNDNIQLTWNDLITKTFHMNLITNKFLNWILTFLFEKVPLTTFIFFNSRLKPIHKRLSKLIKVTQYFANFNWQFEKRNLIKLQNEIDKNEKDRIIFNLLLKKTYNSIDLVERSGKESLNRLIKNPKQFFLLRNIYNLWCFMHFPAYFLAIYFSGKSIFNYILPSISYYWQSRF